MQKACGYTLFIIPHQHAKCNRFRQDISWPLGEVRFVQKLVVLDKKAHNFGNDFFNKDIEIFKTLWYNKINMGVCKER